MSPATSSATHTVVVFSHSPQFREQVRLSVGTRPAPDLGRIEFLDAVTGDEVVAQVDAGGIDLLILDGEAQPTGGMGICRQLKNERGVAPTVCIAIARRDDRWLATWSQADAVLVMPLDPVVAAETVAELLRTGPVVLTAR